MLEDNNLIYQIIVASFVMPLLLSAGLLWFFISYNKRKTEYQLSLKDQELKRQALIIEKQNALAEERTRIASEMHDDLGGGLTSIRFLSQRVLRQVTEEGTSSSVEKIVKHSEELVTNMSDIIWAMNAGNDSLSSLIAYCRRYALEWAENYNLEIQYNATAFENDFELSGVVRRNIYLILKEALNNIVKHSQANSITISWNIADMSSLTITDNGVGIIDNVIHGNGLKNMQTRAEEIDGNYTCSSDTEGTTLLISFPLHPRL